MTKMLRIWAMAASLLALMNVAGNAFATTPIASRPGPCAGMSGCADDDDGDDEGAPMEIRRRHSDIM